MIDYLNYVVMRFIKPLYGVFYYISVIDTPTWQSCIFQSVSFDEDFIYELLGSSFGRDSGFIGKLNAYFIQTLYIY